MLERSTLLFLKASTCGISACAWDKPRGEQSSLRLIEMSTKSAGLITPLSSWRSQVADPPTPYAYVCSTGYSTVIWWRDRLFRSTVEREAAAILFPSVVREPQNPGMSVDIAAMETTSPIFSIARWLSLECCGGHGWIQDWRCHRC